MGPYCRYCDKRCFVERRLPFQTGTLLMATCSRGMDHDRAETGHDFRTAVNPSKVLEAPVVDDAAALESARSLVTRLEGQVALLVERMDTAARLLHDLGGCCCVGFDGCDDQGDDDGLEVRERCSWCQVDALLSTAWLNPTGMDRLFDALGMAVVGRG